MLTPTIDSASSQANTPTRSADLGKKEIFLQLLVAQMKYQDPLNPQDPTKMSSQLAQFNMVEQQTNTNALLEQMLSQGGQDSVSSPSNAASYLGHTATISSQSMAYAGQNVSFSLDLSANAADVQIQILDGNGQSVRTMMLGPMQAGSHALSWDGLNDLGVPLPQGEYQALIQAADAQGNPIATTMTQQGIVTAVQFSQNEPRFVVAGLAVPQSAITEIKL